MKIIDDRTKVVKFGDIDVGQKFSSGIVKFVRIEKVKSTSPPYYILNAFNLSANCLSHFSAEEEINLEDCELNHVNVGDLALGDFLLLGSKLCVLSSWEGIGCIVSQIDAPIHHKINRNEKVIPVDVEIHIKDITC